MRNWKLFILLSVMILSVAGCATKTAKNTTEDVTEPSEDVVSTEATTETKEAESEETVTEAEPEVTNVTVVTKQDTSETKSKEEASSPKQEAEQTAKQEQAVAKEEDAKTPEPKQEETADPKQEEVKIPEPEQPKAVAYDPNQVRSLAISKCQAGGMITTEDNLAKNLAEGKITQEEYNEYYPLDGLENSYYSVFVETDLNNAATTSGRKLGSVDGIAQYIADMLLLEQDPLFNITYAGVTSMGGTDFYEFRCHR